jgi:hypothetical protein
MLYKGTLSSGVEIAVVSSSVTSVKDWSKECESRYRKKVACYLPQLFCGYKKDRSVFLQNPHL